MKIFVSIVFMICCIFGSASFADEVDVVAVEVNKVGDHKYRIDVTLKHADTGWKHYANAWQVFDVEGNMIGERVLHHPHVNEQPFTRSLTLTIAKEVKVIIIKGQDLVHGLGGIEKRVELP